MANSKKLVRESPIDPEECREITLGEEEYVMLPQPIGHLRSELGVALGNLENIQLEASNILDLLGARVYAVLKVFLPDVMPEYRFHGFATVEDWEANRYNREYDKSPNPKQIKKALQAAAELNEIDLLKHLGKLLGPDLIRGMVAEALKRSMDLSESSPTSSVENTPQSTPESSSTPVPTSPLTSAEGTAPEVGEHQPTSA